jgi:hypothetical protein
MKMKTTFLVLSLLCLVSASAYALDPFQTIYSCNFENPPFVAGTTINGVGGWTSTVPTKTLIMAEPTPATNQFFYVGKPSSSNTMHTVQTVSAKERVRFSYDWTMISAEAQSNVDAQGLWMMLTGDAGNGRTGIVNASYDTTTSTGWFRAYDNPGTGLTYGWRTFGSVVLGTKYRLAMDVDLNTRTYDVYVDGTQMLSGLKFYTSTQSYVSTIFVYKRYQCGDYGLDNMLLEATPEPSSLLALGSGMIGILGFIRRKR